MDEVTNRIEKEIVKMIPETFVVAFDGWPCMQARFFCVLAMSPSRGSTGYTECPLGFSLSEKEDHLDAAANQSFLEFVFSVFSKSIDNDIYLVEDNCPTNKAFANLIQRTLLQCHSHGFNLAVQGLIGRWK